MNFLDSGDDIANSFSLESPLEEQEKAITLIAKWRGQQFVMDNVIPSKISVRDVKDYLEDQTSVLPRHQRLIGLGKPGQPSDDDTKLSVISLKLKEGCFSFLMMGTPEYEILSNNAKLSEALSQDKVLNDFDLNIPPSAPEWEKIALYVSKTNINFISQPRDNFKLVVLDLDHTLLDFTSHGPINPSKMKRPYLDYFLTHVYQFYDLAIWSQTHWKWVEVKLIELGLLTNPGFKICFVLDKSSMFRDSRDKYVKPLQVIWAKCPSRWGRRNTIHIDDARRNFALNPENGVLVTPWRSNRTTADTDSAGVAGAATSAPIEDSELLTLSAYLAAIAQSPDLSQIDHSHWRSHTPR